MEATAARYADRPAETSDRRPSVSDNISRGLKSVAALHEALDSLTTQPHPVLAPETPEPTDGSLRSIDEARSPRSPTVDEAIGLESRIATATRRVYELMDRLQP